MPNATQEKRTEKQMAFDKYKNEREKLATQLYKRIKKLSRCDSAAEILIASILLGGIFGVTLIQTDTKVPVNKKRTQSTEYKIDTKKIPSTILHIITMTALIALMIGCIKGYADSTKNHNIAETLSEEHYKNLFRNVLSEQYQNDNQLSHLLRATALVLNNMPESQLERLRWIAETGLTRNINGRYSIKEDSIKESKKIVSDFIARNMELEFAIMQIMRGNSPRTYFLMQAKEKVK